VYPEVVEPVGGFSTGRTPVLGVSGVDRTQVLGEPAAVGERGAAAATRERFRTGVSRLVSTESLLRLEGLAALGAHMARCHFRLMYHLLQAQSAHSQFTATDTNT